MLTGSSPIDIHHIIALLNTKFSHKDLGKLSYFLGVEVEGIESRTGSA